MLLSQQEVLEKFVHVVAKINGKDDQESCGCVSKWLGKGVLQRSAVQSTGKEKDGENVVSKPGKKESKIQSLTMLSMGLPEQ